MGKTILVVDDAAIIRQINTLTLKKQGFDVVEAIHGKDALERIKGKKIDLVVTDINMPEMGGIELIRELRKKDEFRFVPIIVLSTLAQEDRVKEGKEAGATGWLYKPFNATQLIETVRKFLP
jgi:two-component system chemotaxis response regulator CheY